MSQHADGGGNSDGPSGSSPARSTRVRRNCPWTEAEHRLFLLGLEKYGRGSWRNIAAEFVTTRTATQKYFLRDSGANQIRKRQRPSIHDIRSSSSVPSTQLEQEQLKCSLQRINKQSMELEMNAASDFQGIGGASYGFSSAPQTQLVADDPSQKGFPGHHAPGSAQPFFPPGQSQSQILAQNVLRGLLNSPFQLSDLNPLANGHRDGAGAANPRGPHFAAHAVTAPAAGAMTSFPTDVFGDMSDLAIANSTMSPRAYALSGRHVSSEPNPMASFAQQSPSSLGGPSPARSALLSQHLHAASGSTDDAAAHQQRMWLADMATSAGLEHLYPAGERPGLNSAGAAFNTGDRQQRNITLPAAALSSALSAVPGAGGLPQHMYPQAQQAVAQLVRKDPNTGSTQQGSGLNVEQSSSGDSPLGAPLLTASQAGFAAGEHGQVGAGTSDPFLQLLQGLKVAKALQGGLGNDEAQFQDSNYKALVQMLAQHNMQMSPQLLRAGAGASDACGLQGALSSPPPAAQLPTAAPGEGPGAVNSGLKNLYGGRMPSSVGANGSIAGLEDMHALAALVAHSTGMPVDGGGGSAGFRGGPEGGIDVMGLLHGSAPMETSAAPPPAFNGGNGAAWDVSSKQMQDMPPQFHEALSRLHASVPANAQWANPPGASSRAPNPQ